jgi:hypothetical protein
MKRNVYCMTRVVLLTPSDKCTAWVKQVNLRAEVPRPGECELVCGGPPCQGVSGFNRFRCECSQIPRVVVCYQQADPKFCELLLRLSVHTPRLMPR